MQKIILGSLKQNKNNIGDNNETNPMIIKINSTKWTNEWFQLVELLS